MYVYIYYIYIYIYITDTAHVCAIVYAPCRARLLSHCPKSSVLRLLPEDPVDISVRYVEIVS